MSNSTNKPAQKISYDLGNGLSVDVEYSYVAPTTPSVRVCEWPEELDHPGVKVVHSFYTTTLPNHACVYATKHKAFAHNGLDHIERGPCLRAAFKKCEAVAEEFVKVLREAHAARTAREAKRQAIHSAAMASCPFDEWK